MYRTLIPLLWRGAPQGRGGRTTDLRLRLPPPLRKEAFSYYTSLRFYGIIPP